jgi:DNA-binding XRE family transcriptional regulator
MRQYQCRYLNTDYADAMVRVPLSSEQVKAGQRLGVFLRAARAGRDPESIARAAGISPETLRKIEVGRIPSPSFGTVVGLCEALGLPLQSAVDVWREPDHRAVAI